MFNNLGQLGGIPAAAGYPKDFDRAALALKSPPKVGNYRGLYFVSFSPQVEPLAEYLAGAREYIDLILDQAETGM